MPSRTGVPGVLEEHGGVLALGTAIILGGFALVSSVVSEEPGWRVALTSPFLLLLVAGGAPSQHHIRRMLDGNLNYVDGFLQMTAYRIPSSVGEHEIRRYSERRDVLVMTAMLVLSPWVFVDAGGAVHLLPFAISAAMGAIMMLGINVWWRAVMAARLGTRGVPIDARAERRSRLRSMTPGAIVGRIVVGVAFAVVGIGTFAGLTVRHSPIGGAVLILVGAYVVSPAIRAAALRRHAARAQPE